MTSTSYYPEMGGTPTPNVFHASHNFRDSWSIFWTDAHDTQARAELKRLRIRPLKGSPIERRTTTEWLTAKKLGEDGYGCLVNGKAFSKLMDAGLCDNEMLLD